MKTEIKPEVKSARFDENLPLIEVEEIKPIEVKTVDPVLELLNRPTLKFSDVDNAITIDNVQEVISAPKNIERLEELSQQRNAARKAEELADTGDQLKIIDEPLSNIDVGIQVIS